MSKQDEVRALCINAGVLPHEMHDDPVLGLCVSPSGLRKLAAISPNREAANAVRGLALKVERPATRTAQ